jgi:acyl-homoserine lactone acylase PvdQ
MTVTLRRDDWGMAHVTAASEGEAFFAVGWAQAEDHLDGLLQTYAVLAGRGAEVLGARGALLDGAQHRWRHLKLAREALPGLPERVRVAHEAFVAGVRAYVQAHPDEVPDWLPPLEPAMALAVYRMHLWPAYMVADALESLARAGVAVDETVLQEIAAADATGGASNEVFLSADRTADGGAVLLSDPHGSIAGFPMSEVRIRAGEIDAVGVCAVGAALPILGHARRLAWGMTTGGPQVSDAYALRDPEVVRRSTTIAGQEHVVEEVLLNDRVGSVVARSDGNTYVACTTYDDVVGVMEAELYGLLTAPTAAAGRDALRTLGMFPQNVLLVDADGACVYVRAGRAAIRAEHVDPTLPVDGDDPKNAWRGVHPLDDLVQVENPPSGWFACDNAAPDMTYDGAESGPLRAESYPSYLFNDRPGRTHGRQERHKELLRLAVDADTEQLRAIATDDFWPGTGVWQRALRRAAVGATPPLTNLLLQFDGHAAPDSAAALTWWYWRTAVGTLSALTPEQVRDLAQRVEAGTETPEDRAALLAAVAVAAGRMVEDGAVGATYGERFRIGIGGASFPGRGGSFPAHAPSLVLDRTDTVSAVRMMVYGEPDAHGIRWAHSGGRSLRLVQFTTPIRSHSVVLFGQSTRSGSPHLSDQAQLFSTAQLRSTYFDEEELRVHVVSSVDLVVPEGVLGG